MHVSRIGLTPIKGGRHGTREAVRLTRSGPVGDRAFCLVDPANDRCIRTIENPGLMQTCADWDGRVLSVALPSGDVAGEPLRTGEVRAVDYWGRVAAVEVVDGPWAAAFSDHLGREVVLVACRPGDVVYGGPVTLVTASSLARLAEQVGAPVDSARFRATFQLDGDPGPDAETDWVGRRLRLGTAELRVSRPVARCAVVDRDPESGLRDLDVLAVLRRRPPAGGEVVFGLDAEVTVPGEVRTGDAASLTGETG